MDRIKELVTSYKLPVLLTLVGGVLLAGGLFTNFSQTTVKKTAAGDFPKESIVSPDNISKNIKIDVSGAVKTPGVYSFSTDSRIEDAIKRAGGFSEGADKEFISKKLNLSQKLSDGAKIYVPFAGENYSPQFMTSGVSTAVSTGGLIGINSSDSKTLEALPGIGAVTAQKIISGRPYTQAGELLSKKIVSKSVYEKIKDQIDLN